METLRAIAEHLKFTEPLRASIIAMCAEAGSCSVVADAGHLCPDVFITHGAATYKTNCSYGDTYPARGVIDEWLDGLHAKAV